MKQFHILVLIFTINVFFVPSGGVNSPIQQITTIKIGVLVPEAIFPGIEAIKGIELAVEEVNINGINVGGTLYNIELFKETTTDSSGLPNPSTARNSLAKLVDDDGVLAIIGGYKEDVVAVIQTELNRTPFLGISSPAPIFSEYFFRVGPSNGSRLSYALSEFYGVVMNELGVKNITVVREDAFWTTAMSSAIRNIISNNYASQGLTNNFTYSDDLVISSSASPNEIESLLSGITEDTNALLTLFNSPVGRLFTEAWTNLDMNQWLAGINVESQARNFFQQTEGAAYGEIELEALPRDINSTTKTASFKQAFYDYYHEIPSVISFFGYDAIYIIIDAFERAGTVDKNLLYNALIDTDYQGAAHRYKFTSENNQTMTPDGVSTTVHDIFTPMSYGIRGGEYSQPVMVQWQKNGKKVTVWGLKSFAEEINDLNIGLPKLLKAPINHSDFGFISTDKSLSSSSSSSITFTVTTSIKISLSESLDTTSNPKVTTTPGFIFYSLIAFIGIFIIPKFTKKRKKMRKK